MSVCSRQIGDAAAGGSAPAAAISYILSDAEALQAKTRAASPEQDQPAGDHRTERDDARRHASAPRVPGELAGRLFAVCLAEGPQELNGPVLIAPPVKTPGAFVFESCTFMAGGLRRRGVMLGWASRLRFPATICPQIRLTSSDAGRCRWRLLRTGRRHCWCGAVPGGWFSSGQAQRIPSNVSWELAVLMIRSHGALGSKSALYGRFRGRRHSLYRCVKVLASHVGSPLPKGIRSLSSKGTRGERWQWNIPPQVRSGGGEEDGSEPGDPHAKMIS
jgi:hypothetical protein